jgi:hypothetical protein
MTTFPGFVHTLVHLHKSLAYFVLTLAHLHSCSYLFPHSHVNPGTNTHLVCPPHTSTHRNTCAAALTGHSYSPALIPGSLTLIHMLSLSLTSAILRGSVTALLPFVARVCLECCIFLSGHHHLSTWFFSLPPMNSLIMPRESGCVCTHCLSQTAHTYVSILHTRTNSLTQWLLILSLPPSAPTHHTYTHTCTHTHIHTHTHAYTRTHFAIQNWNSTECAVLDSHVFPQPFTPPQL